MRGGEGSGRGEGPGQETGHRTCPTKPQHTSLAYIKTIVIHTYTHTHIYRYRREYLGIVVYVISAPVAAKTRMWPHQAR